MVVAAEDGLHGDAAADDIFASDGDLQAFFHQTELEVAAGGGGRLEAVEEELEWLLNEDAFPALETMEALTGPRTKPMAAERRCQHCGATTTPQWRQGPEGPRTLCNACGVRYRSGRLLPEYRPLNSPTFSPEAHSNKHRCVVEMRLRPGSSGADANALGPLTSPFPRSSRSRKVLKKQKTTTGSCRGRRQMPSSHIHRGSSGSWYGNGGKVWFLQGLEATAVGGGGGGALAVEHGRVTADGDGREEAVGVGASDHGGVPAATGTNVEPLATTACGGGCTCGCREGTRFRRGLDCCGTKTMLQRREAVAAGEHEVLSSKDTFPAMEPEPSVVLPPTEGVLRRGRAQTSSLSPQRCPATEPGQRRCRHCGTTETSQWREGPEGRGTLCNACGVRYGKGRLVPEYRPLSSPTFSAELHSNMQRSIVQMTLPGK